MNEILITPVCLLPNFVAFKRAICPITTTLFLTHYIYYVASRKIQYVANAQYIAN